MSLKESILKLRGEGKTYSEIQEELSCSRGVISYHCGVGQKQKAKIRFQNRSTESKLLKKIDLYLSRSTDKRLNYIARGESHQQILLKILKNPKCYITGETIDLGKVGSYSLDHIEPFSKTQDNSVDNMGLCLKEVNKSKSDMTLKEYFKLCEKVLKANGYTVVKI